MTDAVQSPKASSSAGKLRVMRLLGQGATLLTRGGAGGVGVAQLLPSSTSFAYVHADGVAFDGPVTVFGSSGSQVAVTNINGSFVVTSFGPMGSGLATEIAASGCQ